MIVKQKIIIDNIEYQKTFSDLNYYILDTKGVKYISAIDPQGHYDREYTESDKLIPQVPDLTEEEIQKIKARALQIKGE